jgi:DNA-binding winged helix-turn-helix (wHTH) protein
LSGIEQSLLYLLASRPGRVVTREQILDAIWGTDFVAESNVVDRHVRSLRIKLQDDYRHPRFIAHGPRAGVSIRPDLFERGLGRRTRSAQDCAHLNVAGSSGAGSCHDR